MQYIHFILCKLARNIFRADLRSLLRAPLRTLLLLALLSANVGWAADAVTLHDGAEGYVLSPHLRYLEDKNAKLTLEQVRSPALAAKFLIGKNATPNFGFTTSAYWFRIDVLNRHSTVQRWLLESQYPVLDLIDVYLVYPDNRIVSYQGGDTLPFSRRVAKHRNVMFNLALEQGQGVSMYFRVKTDTSMQFPLALWSAQGFQAKDHEEQLIFGIYYGVLAAIFLYNLLLYLSIRDTNYLHYLHYLGGWGLLALTINGLAFEYLWPNNPRWGNIAMPFFIGLTGSGVVQFARKFLDLRDHMPIANRLLIVWAWFSLASMLCALFASYPVAIKVATSSTLTGAILTFFISMICLKKGVKKAKFFFLAWSIGLVFGSLYAFKSFGLLPNVFVTEYGGQIGAEMEMFLLSFALAHRMRILKEENERIQREAIDTLELRVLQRTAELDHTLKNLAIANEKRAETLQQTSDTLMHLGMIGQEITGHLDAAPVLHTLDRHVHNLLDADYFAIYLIDPDGQGLRSAFQWLRSAAQGETAEAMPERLVALSHPSAFTAQCARERREIMVDIAPGEDHPNQLDDTMQASSAMFMPLTVDERVIGVMSIQSPRTGAYGERERLIFRNLCAFGAIALDNANAYRQLQAAQARLVAQEKLAALGAMVAGVAHELNTPIGNCLMIASSLQQRTVYIDGKMNGANIMRSELLGFIRDAKEASDVILRGLTSAAELVSSFKQVAVDRTTAHRRAFDLRQTCQELIATMMNQIRAGGHDVTLDIPEGIIIDSYPGPFGQVLANFINNTLLHAFEENGTGSGLGRSGQIAISARLTAPNRVQIACRDDGIGISEQNLKRVFDPFFTTKMGQGGCGLGLSICFNIVTSLLNGHIDVDSKPGQGTCFTLDLPLDGVEI